MPNRTLSIASWQIDCDCEFCRLAKCSTSGECVCPWPQLGRRTVAHDELHNHFCAAKARESLHIGGSSNSHYARQYNTQIIAWNNVDLIERVSQLNFQQCTLAQKENAKNVHIIQWRKNRLTHSRWMRPIDALRGNGTSTAYSSNEKHAVRSKCWCEMYAVTIYGSVRTARIQHQPSSQWHYIRKLLSHPLILSIKRMHTPKLFCGASLKHRCYHHHASRLGCRMWTAPVMACLALEPMLMTTISF